MEYIILLLNNVFAFFDRIIAWSIAESYNLIIKLSEASVLDSGVVQQFSSRVSVLLAIFMLFWLAFRLVKYAINPELLSDGSQGFGKITVNVVIMFVMLATVNFVFTYAMDFQRTVVNSNVLMKVVFGVSGTTSNPTNKSNTGNEMAYYLYSAFITPDEKKLIKCKNYYGLDTSSKTSCHEQIESKSSISVRNSWVNGYNQKNVKHLLSSSVVSARDGADYLFNYIPVVSTVCGVVMLVLVVSIAVDVAVRVVKLAFLQIIAPIPIISFIDPNSGKSGIFKNWLKMVGSTYISLFIKLITIYFTVFFVSYAAKGEIILGYENNKPIYATIQDEPFIIVLIIIGTLMFAKNLPKLISEIFGVNLDGGSFSSVAKAMKTGAVVAGAGALGFAGGVAANTLNMGNKVDAFGNKFDAFRHGLKNNKGVKGAIKNVGLGFGAAKSLGSAAFSPFAGGFSASGRSMRNGMLNPKDSSFKSAGAGIAASNAARNARTAYNEAGYNMFKRGEDAAMEFAGIQNKYGGYGAMDEIIHGQEKKISRFNAEEEAYRDYAAQIASSNTHLSLDEYEEKYSNFQKFAEHKGLVTGDGKGNYTINDGKYEEYEALTEQWGAAKSDPALNNYVSARARADSRHGQADVEKGKLDKNKQAYAARNDGKHGSHK